MRADLLTYVDQPTLADGLVLDHDIDLPDTWWATLRSGLEPLRRLTTTKRMAINPRRFTSTILAMFGAEIDRDRIEWEVVHGDLHFGNLTAPDLVILDWECWGWAPQGYDAAHLVCSAILRPDVAARARAEFADVLDTYSGGVAQLIAAAKYLRLVEDGDHPEIAIPVRRHAQDVIREQLTS
ncbi:phosphotransferase [Myceligenerans halotolerans]